MEANDWANAEASDKKTAETERGVNEGECSEAPSRFKRQLPTTISPDRRPTSKAAKRSSGAKKSLAFRQEKENLTNVDAHLNVEGLLGPITKAVDAEFTDYCKDSWKSILLAKTPAEEGRR